jgi:hypothetical protein
LSPYNTNNKFRFMKIYFLSKRLIFCSFFLLCFFFTTPVFGEEINLRDSVKNILKKDQLTTQERFKSIRIIFNKYNPEPSVYEDVFLNTVMPFFEKHAVDESEKQTYRAYIYRDIFIGHANSDRDDDQKKKWLYIEKALQAAELSEDDNVRASIYTNYALHQMFNGEILVAHEYHYKAMRLHEKQKNYPKALGSLYNLAIAYLDIKDVDGLQRIIGEMDRIVSLDSKEEMQYKRNAVKVVCFRTIWDNEPVPDSALKDSALMYARKNIHLIENHREKLDTELTPAWEYFNMATHFYAFYTDKNDSIAYYLNKALAEKELIANKNIATEVDISVYKQFAEMYFREKNYKLAEENLLYVLSILNKVGTEWNTIVTDFTETYQNLVELYEATNRPFEALKYQRLLQESEARRYDSEKINAINDVAAKYETEKKQAHIETLQKEKQASHAIIALVAGLALLLFISLLLMIRVFKSRKERMEQSIYEHALLAEMKHNELEDIKRGLQTSSTQLIVKQVVQRIDESIIEQEKKQYYKNALCKLDAEVFDKAFIMEKDSLSNMDMKYILCFAADIDTADIALVFNVEPASVRTVRYRIKKKINKGNAIFSLI